MERDASQSVEGVEFGFKAHSGLPLLFYPRVQQQILAFEPKLEILSLTCPVPYCAVQLNAEGKY